MDMELRNVKGTYDYSPIEQGIRQGIIRTLQEVFELYGYQPLETPILCYYDVLASKYGGGAEILKEVYQLTDQGQRQLGLRYDLTVPFAKYIGMDPEIRLPFKRYEIGKVFRDGPVKTGRNREFSQCDVDVVGVSSVLAEAELMAMAVEVFNRLGLEVTIVYNNRKILTGIIAAAGIDASQTSTVILSLDKLDKIGASGVQAELRGKGIAENTITCLLDWLLRPESELGQLSQWNMDNPAAKEGLAELEQLQGYLDAIQIREQTRLSPTLARGLEIYTGSVWEIFLEDGCITSSVGAGGRYDKIIGAFIDNGKEYPAVGMTFGLDVIYEALTLKGIVAAKPPADLYIIPLGNDKEVFRIANKLRKLGVRVDLAMGNVKLKKALDYANKQKIPRIVILGEDEWRQGRVKLRKMSNGDEQVLNIQEFEDGEWDKQVS